MKFYHFIINETALIERSTNCLMSIDSLSYNQFCLFKKFRKGHIFYGDRIMNYKFEFIPYTQRERTPSRHFPRVIDCYRHNICGRCIFAKNFQTIFSKWPWLACFTSRSFGKYYCRAFIRLYILGHFTDGGQRLFRIFPINKHRSTMIQILRNAWNTFT